MAAPVIDNLLLPVRCILVLPDAPDGSTGTICRRSSMGGGIFNSILIQSQEAPFPHTHILYVKEMSTEVEVDEIEYLAMHETAVVGLIPD